MAAPFEVVHQRPDRLIVSAPGSSLATPLATLPMIVLFLLIMYLAGRSTRRVFANSKSPAELSAYMLRFWLIGIGALAACLALLWLIAYNSGSIVLDRATNTATLRAKMTLFLPPQSRTIRLDNIQEAMLDYKPNARRIRLIAHHGSDLVYPVWTSRPGQQEAVAAINAFLGTKDEEP